MKKSAVLIAITLMAGALGAQAADATYHFGSAHQRTNVTFESQTDFETVLGSTNQIAGSITGDAERGVGSVSIEVPVASLNTGIAMRDDHLRSPMWLDAEKYPTIQFKSVSARKLSGTKWRVRGMFTMHGVSKELSVDADVRQIPAAAAKAAGLEEGDWVRVTAPFTVRLSEFGVKVPEMAAAKVNDTWTVKVVAFANTRG
jgi:polyisoprenoid-binding protein YceI